MDAGRQDPVAEIEQAVIALRHLRPHGRGPRGGPPWASGGRPMRPAPAHLSGLLGGPSPEHAGGLHRGPRDRSLGGAARFRLLGALRERDGMSVSELAEVIGVDQSRASRLVNDSAERGLVTRRADERDARRSVVELTEAGRAMLETARELRRSAVSSALAGFSPDETATLAALLGRFVAAWPRE